MFKAVLMWKKQKKRLYRIKAQRSKNGPDPANSDIREEIKSKKTREKRK
tara:strand:+ start:8843 stop:8989 length:147 start_codon:yes stop_codon:yes gene_type:complete